MVRTCRSGSYFLLWCHERVASIARVTLAGDDAIKGKGDPLVDRQCSYPARVIAGSAAGAAGIVDPLRARLIAVAVTKVDTDPMSVSDVRRTHVWRMSGDRRFASLMPIRGSFANDNTGGHLRPPEITSARRSLPSSVRIPVAREHRVSELFRFRILHIEMAGAGPAFSSYDEAVCKGMLVGG